MHRIQILALIFVSLPDLSLLEGGLGSLNKSLSVSWRRYFLQKLSEEILEGMIDLLTFK